VNHLSSRHGASACCGRQRRPPVQLQTYWISSCKQPTRSGPPSLGVGGGRQQLPTVKHRHITRRHCNYIQHFNPHRSGQFSTKWYSLSPWIQFSLFMEMSMSLTCSQQPAINRALNDFNSLQNFARSLYKTQFNIMLPSAHRYPEMTFHIFWIKLLYNIFISPIRANCLAI
jgi:hypothetical protein